MQGDVFGLNRLYELQVQNKEGTDTFQSSPVNYGYYAGGSLINLYSRLDFSNESVSVISGNYSSGTLFDARFNKMLAITRGNLTSAYTPNYGYVIGGITSPTTYTNTIERFQFSTETNSLTASARLNQEKGQAATVFNDNYAYVCGGFSPLVTSCTIDRLEFGTETVSSPGKNLPTTKYIFSGVSSPSTNYGYLGAGFFPTDACTITRLDFTTETAINSGKSMAPARFGSGSVFNSQFGYWGGGYINPPITFYCSISRIEFSTETITSSSANLSQARLRLSGLQGSQNGYYAGGQIAGPAVSCQIDRLNFSTETASSSLGTYLSYAIQGLTGFSASTQRKVTRNYFSEDKLYGFIAGGTVNPGTVATCRIDRLDYSNETISSPGKNLTSNRDSYANASSNQYGYFGVGLLRGSVPPTLGLYTSSIDRIEYSTETVRNLSSALTSRRQDLSGTHSDNYGYFAGGVIPGPITYSTIDRIDFSTETTSLPGNSLTFAKRSTSTGSVRSEYYGYIAGGRDPGSNYYSNINKIDFTTEVVSDTTSFLASGRSSFGGAASNSYAYWASGADSSSVYCLIDRLEFSTDTINADGNLPSRRSSTTAISNFSFGYWCGGSAPTRVSTLNRVDFYNSTTSVPGTRLSSARSALGSVSGGSGGSSRIGKYLTNMAIQYGYYGGGYSITPPVRICTISRLDLTTETSNNIPNQLTEARTLMGSVSSNTFGYYLGGDNATPVRVCTIDRLDFSTEVVSAPATQLLAARAGLSAVKSSNSDLGYFGGGLDATTYNCSINRIDFSTESIVNISKFLLTNGAYAAYSQNSLYGFFAGGLIPTPVISCRIDRLDFGTETFSTVPVGMPQARFHMAATQTGQYGYFAGGDAPGAVNTITRLDFINDTISTPANALKTPRRSNVGTSSLLYGYYAGGSTPPNIYLSTIDRLDFGTETVRTSSNFMSNSTDLPTSLTASAKTISRYRTTVGTYGYFGGGDFPTGTVSTIDRLDFSNETVSAPGTYQLKQARYELAAVSNSNYGYFGGGFAPPIRVCTIDRLDFSNETISAPGNDLTRARGRLAAVSNSNYGYFGGGYFTPPATAYSTIDRLDFSNETTSAPGKNLPQGRFALAAVSNFNYGYFAGGQTFPYVCTIDRLDFATETVLNPNPGTYQLTQARSRLAAVSNSNYGYFAGGFVGLPGSLSTIDRIDFSTETVSTPGNNLTPERQQLAAVSSSNYGYFAGGYATGPTYICTIDRLDFSNDTVSAPSNKLTQARRDLGAVSTDQRASTGQKGFAPFSATYGYFIGGLGRNDSGPTPVVSANCIVYRLDFSTETSSEPGKNLSVGANNTQVLSNASFVYFNPLNGNSETCLIQRLDFTTESLTFPGKNLFKSFENSGTVNNSSYGYFCGGNLGSPDLSTIHRIDFSNENVTKIQSELSSSRTFVSRGIQNQIYGYLCGGSGFSTVDRLDFSTETVSMPGINLSGPGAVQSQGMSSDSFGYMIDGYLQQCRINRLDFSTESITIQSSTREGFRQGSAVSGAFGYFGGGYETYYARLDFNTEVINTTNASVVPASYTSIPNISGASNSYKPPIRNGWGWRKTYGYFGGGYSPQLTSTPRQVCTIDRLDFSTEILSRVDSTFFNEGLNSLAATSSSSYAYFGGGVPGSGYVNTIMRLDFSTETRAFPGNNLTQTKIKMATSASGSYGYFGGGYQSNPNVLVCTINRLDFSTELMAISPGQLTQARKSLAAVFNASYGYFGGGEIPPVTGVNTVDRLDFSTDVIAVPSPGKNLTQARYGLAAVSSGSYGYFGGGLPPSRSTIDRIDFSTETTSAPGKNLTQARQEFAAVSSGSYGYFGGGSIIPTTTQVTTIDRIDFSTETTTLSTQKLNLQIRNMAGIQAN